MCQRVLTCEILRNEDVSQGQLQQGLKALEVEDHKDSLSSDGCGVPRTLPNCDTIIVIERSCILKEIEYQINWLSKQLNLKSIHSEIKWIHINYIISNQLKLK